jgi:soluble lytic murein transglycosylase
MFTRQATYGIILAVRNAVNSKKPIFIGCATALIFMFVLTMSDVNVENSNDSNRYHPARTIQMIERHLQDGRTDLSSKQIPSFAKLIYEEANFHGIDYRLILAIMAVESRFRTDAVSRAGARGIMQIMPILASFIAKIAGIPYRDASDLFNPENNVRLGLYYLSWLGSIFKSTQEVLLAYNIGHNRAKLVLSRSGDADSDYTRRVMSEYHRNMESLPAI